MIEVVLSDAIEYMQKFPDESMDLVLTDPPYGISYQSSWTSDKSKPISSDWNFQIAPLMTEISRVLKPDRAAYIFTRWDVYPIWVSALPANLQMKNLIIWNKNNHTSGDLTGNFGFKYECIMFLTKGKPVLQSTRYPNVWDFSRVSHAKSLHPSEKPVPLLQRCIESSTSEGDSIIDPYCGSGTTGLAAKSIGRNAYLSDIDPSYVNISRKRLGLSYDTIRVKSNEKSTSLTLGISKGSLRGYSS